MEYSFKLTLFSARRTVSLGERGLTIADEGSAAQEVPFGDVTEVALLYMGRNVLEGALGMITVGSEPRDDLDQKCVLKVRGGRKVVIPSRSFELGGVNGQGGADLDLVEAQRAVAEARVRQGRAYLDLVRGLHRALQWTGAQVRYLAGNELAMSVGGGLVAAAVLFPGVPLGLALYMGERPPWQPLLALLLALPAAWFFFKGWPRPYDPRSLAEGGA